MTVSPSPAAIALGAALRDARKQAGLTQLQLAELAGLSDRTVREIEKGSGSPGLAAVLTVADVLGMRLELRS
ncbi:MULTISPECIES: helix-turn-helix domain-containing protein [unclassified Brachybacterium]|uniref:helix-turn-helix domain-containing protein n=1 Tax=unclassified Brachybacterium TaxID=2623841 RepID=UPI000C80DD39|nr:MULTISPECIES: helix-turn-helix domain-containing protein [unclassified Brachybacterium]PMC75092.1 transcriptional regulator [Brachybacterium sp. UMB0905]